MKVFLVFCLVASAFAYPQYARYDLYPNPQEAPPKPCSVCRANQEILRQTGSPIFQTSDQSGIRYDRSIVIEETVPVLVNSPDPAPILVNAPSTRIGRGIYKEEAVPVLVKTAGSEGIVEDPTPELVNPAGPSEEVIIQETSGPVAERVVILRAEGLKRESRSPDETASVPVLTMSSFDDTLVPVLTDFPSQDFLRHTRSIVDELTPSRVTRSAMPEMIPILTNIPAQNINNEMIESILRSARSLQSTNPTNAAVPAVAEQQPAPVPTKDVSPLTGKVPQSFGMYYVRVKSFNYPEEELSTALKESSSVTTNKPCTKEQDELQKKYFEQQDKEFSDFMQQLLVQQFSSLLEQQLVQQQNQLKKFLNKQLEDELKTTTPSVPTSRAPVTPVSGNFAETKVPGGSSANAEKIEVTGVEQAQIPIKGKDLEAPSNEKV